MGNASKGKYKTVNNSSSGEVTFQKCLKSGITLFSSKNSNKSQTFATGAYQTDRQTDILLTEIKVITDLFVIVIREIYVHVYTTHTRGYMKLGHAA